MRTDLDELTQPACRLGASDAAVPAKNFSAGITQPVACWLKAVRAAILTAPGHPCQASESMSQS